MNENQVENKPIVNENQPETVQVAVAEPTPQIKSEENQANWRAFREQREAERKARLESERLAAQKAQEADALKAALEALATKGSNNEDYQTQTESEDERIDRRVREIIAEREAKIEREMQEREKKEFPQRLQAAYKDFNQVVSTENLDYLDYHYPEISRAFNHMPDGFDKWASVYQAVKRFVPNTDSHKEAQRADRNLSKPGSVSSMGNSHGGNAMPSARLDEARKAANWERMQRTLRGVTN